MGAISGSAAFFVRQDDRPGVFNWQRAIAAWKGKFRYRFLGQWRLSSAGSKLQASCRCSIDEVITRHLVVAKIAPLPD
ncbi:MAG: hypothetical protein JSU83_20680 [Deltaproteobacteria bacterium]|nr:MAG: hypothetical protein JSU83_20680 [Deltaproteobacteria bacterium]